MTGLARPSACDSLFLDPIFNLKVYISRRFLRVNFKQIILLPISQVLPINAVAGYAEKMRQHSEAAKYRRFSPLLTVRFTALWP